MKIFLFSLFIAISCFVAKHVFSTTYYVNGTTGHDAWGGLAKVWDGTHGPKKTIQAGIDASNGLDTIIVASGEYKGEGNREISFNGKDLTLRSVEGPEHTIIDPNSPLSIARPCFIFENGETIASVIDGFTIQNGGTTNVGGGFYIEDSGVIIKNCVIQECIQAVYCHGANADFIDCLFLNNYAYDWSTIVCQDSSTVKLTGCTIDSNLGYMRCDGMQCERSTLLLNNSVVSNNDGCGIWCDNLSILRINNCQIYGNKTNSSGGGINCGTDDGLIENSLIYNNEAQYNGGGIRCFFADLIINNCMIEGNRAKVGGGIDIVHGSAEIRNCIIRNNIAENGGGISIGSNSPELNNCLIYGNRAENNGGGIASYISNPRINNCTFAENEANLLGGGIFCRGNDHGKIKNSIIWGNSAPTAEEIYLGTSYEPSELRISYSDIRSGTNCLYAEFECKLGFEEGNIFDAPLFLRGAIHDYYLSQVESGQSENSPCVDSGIGDALLLGFAELTTRTDGMGDEGIVDMGYHAPYVLWITSIRTIGRNVMLHWNAKPYTMYVVERSFDLVSWSPFFVGMKDHCVDTCHTNQEKYYRVREYLGEGQ